MTPHLSARRGSSPRLARDAATLLLATAALAATGLSATAPAHAQDSVAQTHSSASSLSGQSAAWPSAQPSPRGHSTFKLPSDVRRVCPVPTHPGQMECMSVVRTNVAPRRGLIPDATPSGYGPSDLQSAYALPSSSAGSGHTVAIVDAQDDPNAESDLGTYRSQYGLTACTTANGCFRKVDQNGGANYPAPDSGWAQEISLDLDMVSAICPNCHILLVEANSASIADLGTAVNTAVSLGAKYVSNSYGGSESSSDPSYDSSYYNHSGVAVTVSSGDNGYGVEYPAASRYVTAVGGTSLSRASNSRGWSETAWSGAGAGCSAYDAKPSWQHDTGCSNRTVADVSAVADPNTGVAVYDTYQTTGWQVFGGTSVSSPVIASVYALAGTPASGTYPSSYPYSDTSALNDVTSGSDGTCSPTYLCTAGTGYDGPTGLGTPEGASAFASGGGGGNTVTVNNPGNQTGTVGTAVSLQITATDSASGQTLTYSATGLPAGLSINSSTGLISGTPTTAATYSVTVTATDTTGASGSASFTWTIGSSSGGIVNGGFETGAFSGWTTSGAATSIVSSGAHSGTYAARAGSTSPTNGDSDIAQTFTVPSGDATLSFWYNVTCPDTVTYDWATATLKNNTTGTTTTVLAKTCVSSSGWKQVTASVTAGDSYTLTLISHDDDYTGDPTYTLYDDATLLAAAPNPVVNGGFETGTFYGWTSSGAATSIVSSGAHSGTYAARAGSTSPTNGDSDIAQTFTAASGDSTLTFWYNVSCPDTVTYDWATATLKNNTTGTTTTVLAKTCVSSSGWTKVTASVTAGDSYTLTLISHDDDYTGDPTYTLYDDVGVS